jgi:thiamine biosynthesis lipoprotein ApbE
VSGSNEKFFELNGARYSHVMDPKTGRPVQGVLSVAVITDDGTSGDALDNVFYVSGVERGRALVNKFSASEVIFFLPDQDRKWKMTRIGSRTSANKERRSEISTICPAPTRSGFRKAPTGSVPQAVASGR